MARLTPVSWADLVKRLRKLGFEGPYQGGKHPYMVKGDLTLTIPNPHRHEIGVNLLRRVLKQAVVSREEWLKQ
ncbi:MAG: type II toxin-antitoxin system HicA family toxin [Candidatus Aerophobetes bacterium]|nr:type II toxin-antitoxin system HicA family toxin [Candidatus Aerophobetes bacterium]